MLTDRPMSMSQRDRVPKDEEDARARLALRRQKRVATGLLGGMAVLAGAGVALGRGFWPELLQASAKAGLVGGIADWFAVTALFRRPLGLPIPHTAILPAQKERLGRALGNFVGNHVLTEHDVRRAVERLDVPTLLRNALADPEAAPAIARTLSGTVPHLLDALEDGRAAEMMARLMPRLLDGNAAAPVVARALRALVDDNRHQDVLSFLLEQIKELLRSREAHLRSLIEERVREQGGRLVGWAIGGSVASRVLSAINAELDRSDDSESGLREAVTVWIRREIDLIELDPDRARELAATLRTLLTHESLRGWLHDIWGRLRGVMEADLAEENGWTARLMMDSVSRLGVLLERDETVRARVDAAALRLAMRVLPAVRERVSVFIAGVVAGWNTAELTERLELRVGKDLQFVRINGTLVGFLVGGALFLLEWAAWGAP
jgi:uncharacterized membrane-anchored protein YjiN (DUF445 family)